MLRMKLASAIFLFVLFGAICVKRFSASEDATEDGTDMDKTAISYLCEDSVEIIVKFVDLKTADEIFSKITHLYDKVSKSIERFPHLRNYIPNCNVSKVNITRCYTNSSLQGQYYCSQRNADFTNINHDMITYGPTITVKGGTDVFPKFIHIPVGDVPNSRRQVRGTNVCTVPTPTETAEFYCVLYPRSLKCTQSCKFGYTLPRVNKVDIECMFEDNEWKPAGPRECKPYVNCELTLISTGTLNCSDVRGARECSVECFGFEDRLPIRMYSYTCFRDGDWEPPLPFCVIPKPGVILVGHPDYAFDSIFDK